VKDEHLCSPTFKPIRKHVTASRTMTMRGPRPQMERASAIIRQSAPAQCNQTTQSAIFACMLPGIALAIDSLRVERIAMASMAVRPTWSA
jgi:hypothetical protein